jgi:hypothetical protein
MATLAAAFTRRIALIPIKIYFSQILNIPAHWFGDSWWGVCPMRPRASTARYGAPGERTRHPRHATTGHGKKPWSCFDQSIDQICRGRSVTNCFYVGSSCQAIFLFWAVKPPSLGPRSKAIPSPSACFPTSMPRKRCRGRVAPKGNLDTSTGHAINSWPRRITPPSKIC